MEKTWKPIAASILCIIAGVLILVIPGIVGALNVGELIRPSPEGGYGVIFFILLLAPTGILLVIVGISAMVGGVYALKRRRWRLVLAGSICALIPGIAIGGIGALFFSALPPLGLAFVVFASLALLPLMFVIRGRREFK